MEPTPTRYRPKLGRPKIREKGWDGTLLLQGRMLKVPNYILPVWNTNISHWQGKITQYRGWCSSFACKYISAHGRYFSKYTSGVRVLYMYSINSLNYSYTAFRLCSTIQVWEHYTVYIQTSTSMSVVAKQPGVYYCRTAGNYMFVVIKQPGLITGLF